MRRRYFAYAINTLVCNIINIDITAVVTTQNGRRVFFAVTLFVEFLSLFNCRLSSKEIELTFVTHPGPIGERGYLGAWLILPNTQLIDDKLTVEKQKRSNSNTD